MSPSWRCTTLYSSGSSYIAQTSLLSPTVAQRLLQMMAAYRKELAVQKGVPTNPFLQTAKKESYVKEGKLRESNMDDRLCGCVRSQDEKASHFCYFCYWWVSQKKKTTWRSNRPFLYTIAIDRNDKKNLWVGSFLNHAKKETVGYVRLTYNGCSVDLCEPKMKTSRISAIDGAIAARRLVQPGPVPILPKDDEYAQAVRDEQKKDLIGMKVRLTAFDQNTQEYPLVNIKLQVGTPYSYTSCWLITCYLTVIYFFVLLR